MQACTNVGVCWPGTKVTLGAIRVLRNALGGADFVEKCITKVYGSTLLALRGGWWVSNFQEKNMYNMANGHHWESSYYLQKSTNITY